MSLNECLSVIGRAAHLSLSIHAGHSGLWRGECNGILSHRFSEDISAVEAPPDKNSKASRGSTWPPPAEVPTGFHLWCLLAFLSCCRKKDRVISGKMKVCGTVGSV